MTRRSFVKLAVSAAVLSPLGRVNLVAQTSSLPDAAITTLRSLAPVVLPNALGRRSVEALTDRFLVWLGRYEPGVVMEHGYGHPRIRRTPQSPAPRYIEQLKALEQAADRQHHQPFSRLAPDAKRAIIEAAFNEAKVESLPSLPSGKHVAADLMAFYFQSSEANDHCYQAAIGRETCRPRSRVAARPRPLA
jgi:hypothetical protein